MNPWRGLGNLPREVWIVFTTTLINRSGTMALPFLVLYLTQKRGFSAGHAGLALTFYGVGALITSPVSGRLCDYVGALRIMKLSLVLSGTILFVFPMARRPITILILTLMWAMIAEAFRPASSAILTDLVAPEQRKAAFALSRLAINLGMSIGPAAGGFLAMVSYPAVFLVDGATSILAGVVLSVSPWQAPHQSVLGRSGAPVGVYPQERDRRPTSNWQDTAPEVKAEGVVGLPVFTGGPVPPIRAIRPASVFADHAFLYFLAALIPVEIVFFQFLSAMPLFLVRDLHLSESAFGMLLPINTLLVIFVEVPLNIAMQHWPHRRTLALGALLCGAGFGALAFARGTLSVAATIVMWTFGEMILFPGSAAYAAECAPPERRGQYMGLYHMTFSLAFAIGPWIGTEILQRLSAPVLWSAAFVCGCLSAAMMSRVRPKALESRSQDSGFRI